LIIPEIQNNAKLQMSAYSSAAKWGGACKGVNQSPINLSQSFAKPCDILCDLVFDEGYVSSGVVNITQEGLVLYSQTGLGTCKYNGTGYTCNAIVVNHPSHHTIENIQADAEVIALFTNPVGKKLLVSSLIRVNPAQTDASKFLNRFIPYASTRATTVKFGDDWTLSMMVPPKASYYSYAGSLPLGGCDPAQVIVFSSMINIDSNDFALLVKNVTAGSRPIQGLGDREVFFNSGEQLPGGQMPKDGKIYMRLRPKKDDGKKKDRDIKQPDIAGPQKREQDKAGFFGYISQWARDQTEINGVFSIINAILLFVAFGLAVYCAYKYSEKLQILLYLNDKSIETAIWLRQKVVGGVANYKAARLASATSSSSSSSSNAAVFKNPLAKSAPKTPSMEKAAEETSKAIVPKALGPVDDITTRSSIQKMTPSARKIDFPAAAAPAAVEPVTKVVDNIGDVVTSNPVSEAVSAATRASERAPDTIPVATDKTGTSSRDLKSFGPMGSRGGPVNIDKLLKTTGKSATDKAEGIVKGVNDGISSYGPQRARRKSVAG
jgi:carbonic anhydrase